MDLNMTVVEAMQLRDDLKRNIEGMLLVYSAATGLDLDVQGSAGGGVGGTTFSECTIQVSLSDKPALAKDKVTG